MSSFIRYNELTWPEIEALPRDVPMVLPLGAGYDFGAIETQLGHPPTIALLPSFPFGWRGSEVELPADVLGSYVGNLLDSLRAQGFERVYALTSESTMASVDSSSIIRQSITAEPAASASILSRPDQERVVLFPIGHTEQHGLHLPLCVDTVIIESISAGTVAMIPRKALSLPVMPYGVSTHTTSFPGTLNAGGRAFEDFWVAVVDVLAGHGFDKFYLMSGHGGNSSFLVNVAKYAGERHARVFCATSFLYNSGPTGAAALQEHRTSPVGGMGHACELETSLMLHLRPDLCHMERVVDETDFVSTPSYYMDWIEGGALVANPPWEDDTITGAYGAGSQGTAAKGQIWLASAIAEKVGHVDEIRQQQARREARRNAGYGRWGSRRGE